MLGPLRVKVSEAHIPSLDDVNASLWKYDWEKHELDGLGYVCPRCGNCRIIKPPKIDEATGMLAWD